MTITLGWWALPLLITCVAYGIAFLRNALATAGDASDAIGFLIRMTVATLVTLVSWLIYFIIF